mmetsp:Transcript_6312/g.13255  ORF Transcript_6312/g.13255 Transcript_6312/m.13255 type:complete len:758 (+) Transcript_6312:100-2373(+)
MDVDIAESVRMTNRRVKLYDLNDDGEWDDKGTGYIEVVPTTAAGGDNDYLVVRSEENNQELLRTKVLALDQYTRQGESIVTWDEETEGQAVGTFALSFQHREGLKEFWDHLTGEGRPAPPQEEQYILDLPTMNNIGCLAKALSTLPFCNRERAAAECMSEAFVTRLVNIFSTCEDCGARTELTYLYQLVKSMFLLCQAPLIVRLLRDDVYKDVFGILEYDDGLCESKRILHRQFLAGTVEYKEPVKIEDAKLKERIHMNYRLMYLKDCALPRVLDDGAFACLSQIIFSNTDIILKELQASTSFLDLLFEQMAKDDQCLSFVRELFAVSRTMIAINRPSILDSMGQRGLLPVLYSRLSVKATTEASRMVRNAAMDILQVALTHHVAMVRKHVADEAAESGRSPFLAMLIQLLTDEDCGIQGQAADGLRLFVDTSPGAQGCSGAKDALYDSGLFDDLVAPLKNSVNDADERDLNCRQLICEIVAMCVSQCATRVRPLAQRNALIQRVCKVAASTSNKPLILATIRFFRACLASGCEWFARGLVQQEVFKVLIRIFDGNQRFARGNLVQSALLDLLEFVQRTNVSFVAEHLCTVHAADLEKYRSRYETVDKLFQKHEENKEFKARSKPEASGSSGKRSPGKTSDDEGEAAYFEGDDDAAQADPSPAPVEESQGQAAPQPQLGGLLAGYQDDDENEAEQQKKPESPTKNETMSVDPSADGEPPGDSADADGRHARKKARTDDHPGVAADAAGAKPAENEEL